MVEFKSSTNHRHYVNMLHTATWIFLKINDTQVVKLLTHSYYHSLVDIKIQLANVLLFTAMILHSNRLKHLMVVKMGSGDGCTRSLLYIIKLRLWSISIKPEKAKWRELEGRILYNN